jgi:predicted amidohydrolase
LRLRLIELPVPHSPDEAEGIVLEAAGIRPLPDVFFIPELFSTGYVLDRLPGLARGEGPDPLPAISSFCAGSGVWAVAGTLPVRTSRGIVNRLHVIGSDGSVAHSTEKVHLFRQMGEDRVFAPGIPSGTFETPWMRAGAVVCYDLRFPELSRRLTLAGAEILFVPAQWPEPRMELFRCLLRARSAEAQVFSAGCNIGGEHLGVRFGGGGGVSSPSGSLLEYDDMAMGVRDFTVEPEEVPRARRKIDCLQDRRPEVY